MSATAGEMKPKGRLWRTLAFVSFVATALVFYYYWAGLDARPEQWREMGHGAEAAVAIVLLMAFAWAFALPASYLLFVAPLLFPPHVSAAITTVGCALGTAVGYAVARYFGGAWVERFRDGRLARFLSRHSSFLALFSIRLAPASPHGFINYAAGLAAVPFARFVLATTAALSIKSYVYAQAVHSAVEAESLSDALSGRTLLSLLAVALLAMLGHVLHRRLTRSGPAPAA